MFDEEPLFAGSGMPLNWQLLLTYLFERCEVFVQGRNQLSRRQCFARQGEAGKVGKADRYFVIVLRLNCAAALQFFRDRRGQNIQQQRL